MRCFLKIKNQGRLKGKQKSAEDWALRDPGERRWRHKVFNFNTETSQFKWERKEPRATPLMPAQTVQWEIKKLKHPAGSFPSTGNMHLDEVARVFLTPKSDLIKRRLSVSQKGHIVPPGVLWCVSEAALLSVNMHQVVWCKPRQESQTTWTSNPCESHQNRQNPLEGTAESLNSMIMLPHSYLKHLPW